MVSTIGLDGTELKFEVSIYCIVWDFDYKDLVSYLHTSSVGCCRSLITYVFKFYAIYLKFKESTHTLVYKLPNRYITLTLFHSGFMHVDEAIVYHLKR